MTVTDPAVSKSAAAPPQTLTLDGEEVTYRPGETLYELSERHRRVC